MKLYYFSLILCSILAVSSAETNEDEMKKFIEKGEEAEKIICAKEITDDQLAELENKCEDEHNEKVEPIMKSCLKVEELTIRQRMTAMCKKEDKECILKAWTEQFGNAKPEEIEELVKGFDKAMECVKTVLKIE